MSPDNKKHHPGSFDSQNSNGIKKSDLETSADFPSSFTGLWKYPDGRRDPTRNAYQWIESKRKDDQVGNLWRVYDKLYNLEKFMDKHPGGADWIRVTKGTDITEAYEASHVLNASNVQKILDKYYVADIHTRRNSPYTFHQNGFYKTLKRRVEPILKKVGTGPSPTMLLFQDTLVILFIILSTLSALFDSLPLQILAGIDLSMTAVCAHNFFHIKDNFRKYYFDLSGLCSYEWKISHALSHHMYPNTLLDYEISMLQPMVEMLPKRKRNWIQKYGSIIYAHPLYFLNFLGDILKRIIKVGFGEQKLRPENLIILLELIVYCTLAPSLLAAFKTFILIQGTASYVFGFIGLMAAHHHPICFHDGDEARKDPDFGLCQLDATKDRVEDFTKNLFFVATTFGDHPLHHLFPTVCHSKLKYLKQVFEETVLEFQEKQKKLTQAEFFVGVYQQFGRETPNKLANPE